MLKLMRSIPFLPAALGGCSWILAANNVNNANTRYAPPDVTFNAGNQLAVFQTELDNKDLAAAAQRLDDLLRDNASQLMSPANDASLISVATWIRMLPPEAPRQLASELKALQDKPAGHALDDLRGKPSADPAEFYGVAQRYPFTTVSADALVEGARRCSALGDVPGAACMLEQAVARGMKVDETFRRSLIPPDASATATIPKVPSLRNPPTTLGGGYRGALPFEATWYGGSLRESWTSVRSLPAMAGGVIFFAAPAQVIALKESGGLLWQGPSGASAKAVHGAPDPDGLIRGPAFVPAVFCDASGAPQIVIVRQPETHGDGWAIRAMRASDGKLLWTTEGMDAYHGLVFGSNPAVEGRYLYAVAGDPGEQVDKLSLVALEITTGRQLWRADLGNLTRARIGHRPNRQPDIYRPWMHQSAPTVAGDCVIIAPDVGAVFSIGRFDGKTRWVRSYDPLPEPTAVTIDDPHRIVIEMRYAKAPPKFHPLQPGFSPRYLNTPVVAGNVVISAAEDSDAVLGLDLATGKQLWTTPGLADATLLGVSDNLAVLAGITVSAVSVDKGEIVWSNAELKGAVSGPGVLAGKLVYVPTSVGMTVLDAASGRVAAAGEKMPAVRSIVSGEPARSALTMADVISCFVREPFNPSAAKPRNDAR